MYRIDNSMTEFEVRGITRSEAYKDGWALQPFEPRSVNNPRPTGSRNNRNSNNAAPPVVAEIEPAPILESDAVIINFMQNQQEPVVDGNESDGTVPQNVADDATAAGGKKRKANPVKQSANKDAEKIKRKKDATPATSTDAAVDSTAPTTTYL